MSNFEYFFNWLFWHIFVGVYGCLIWQVIQWYKWAAFGEVVLVAFAIALVYMGKLLLEELIDLKQEQRRRDYDAD